MAIVFSGGIAGDDDDDNCYCCYYAAFPATTIATISNSET